MLRGIKLARSGTGNVRSVSLKFPTSLSSIKLPVLPFENAGLSHLSYPTKIRQFSSNNLPSSTTQRPDRDSPEFIEWALKKLPLVCPGCGAPTQIVDKKTPGFYSLRTHVVVKFLGLKPPPKKKEEDQIVRDAIKRAQKLNLGLEYDDSCAELEDHGRVVESVKCHRCRNIIDHRAEIPIAHPSIEAIRDTIAETPHKYNHIYHVIDAADFPMSLVPELQRVLHTTPLRSKNRRSKPDKYYHGRKTEMSFIIARSDLLAPVKEQVDSMMPYIRATLRDALGRSATDMRLGNIHCVSAMRGWWTKELKEELRNRGGAGWMVGKINVGKSKLFNSIYPKGTDRIDTNLALPNTPPKPTALEEPKEIKDEDLNSESTVSDNNDVINQADGSEKSEVVDKKVPDEQVTPEKPENQDTDNSEEEFLDSELLLPPLPAELKYPEMPAVSDLPGTTAAPIRLSFGKGKGELIDLPGLARGELAKHIVPVHRNKMVMVSRVLPEQLVIKEGQSLLLGGFIRITPTCPDIVLIAYAFTSLPTHVTSTSKAIGTQCETRESYVTNIAVPGTGEKIASAGKFLLKWDVTRKQTGPVTAQDAGRVGVEQLPYRILCTEILIEGCGWIELVAQVSKERGDSKIMPLNPGIDADEPDNSLLAKTEDEAIDQKWPGVEIFTPDGKYAAARRPLSAWHIVKKKKVKQSRPRAAVAGRRERQF
ncbi:hypothetical protein K3495_g3414 [Podosphaera aphanis]|nr:hypothetical protein K3495_g3414 [Podosphaera aphanis]